MTVGYWSDGPGWLESLLVGHVKEGAMCLAIPMKLVECSEFGGVAEVDGVRRQISVIYVPDAQVGDWVLVHAGFAIGQVDEEEAAKTLELLREYSDNMVEL